MLYRAARAAPSIYTIWTGDLASRPAIQECSASWRPAAAASRIRRGRSGNVVTAFGTVAANIRSGYSIGYVPTNTSADGTYRRVRVAVRAPGKKLSVRSAMGTQRQTIMISRR